MSTIKSFNINNVVAKHKSATSTEAGLMSATDKQILDGLASGGSSGGTGSITVVNPSINEIYEELNEHVSHLSVLDTSVNDLSSRLNVVISTAQNTVTNINNLSSDYIAHKSDYNNFVTYVAKNVSVFNTSISNINSSIYNINSKLSQLQSTGSDSSVVIVQSDWSIDDSTNAAYIKNKPVAYTAGTNISINSSNVISNTYSYSLPLATSQNHIYGGVRLYPTGIQNTSIVNPMNLQERTYVIQTDNNGNLVVNVPWIDTNTTYTTCTSSYNGLMSKADKVWVDKLTKFGFVNWIQVDCTNTSVYIQYSGYDSSGNSSEKDVYLPNATTKTSGLMTSDMVSKLSDTYEFIVNSDEYYDITYDTSSRTIKLYYPHLDISNEDKESHCSSCLLPTANSKTSGLMSVVSYNILSILDDCRDFFENSNEYFSLTYDSSNRKLQMSYPYYDSNNYKTTDNTSLILPVVNGSNSGLMSSGQYNLLQTLNNKVDTINEEIELLNFLIYFTVNVNNKTLSSTSLKELDDFTINGYSLSDSVGDYLWDEFYSIFKNKNITKLSRIKLILNVYEDNDVTSGFDEYDKIMYQLSGWQGANIIFDTQASEPQLGNYKSLTLRLENNNIMIKTT